MPSSNAKGGPPSPPPKGKPLVPPGLNQAPVAHNDAFALNEDTSLSGNLLADNGFGADTDPNPGDVLSVIAGTYPSTAHGGTIVIQADGRFDYTPLANFNGTNSFIYSVKDAEGGLSAAATASFTVTPVNDAPVAQDGSDSGNEDTPINGTLVATDVDGPSLTYSLGTQAAHGNVVVNPDGSYIYTPNLDFNGPDSFTFTANDGTAGSNTATISLTVNPVNDAPVAQNGSNSGNEDTPINGTLVATDVDSAALTYSLGTQAAHGIVVVNPDGTYTYTPNLDFNGTDSLPSAPMMAP